MKTDKIQDYQNITIEGLLKHFELLNYPSFGFGAITLYRMTGKDEKWQACLRNPQKWLFVPDFIDRNPKEALIKCYEYCVEKKYLPELSTKDLNK